MIRAHASTSDLAVVGQKLDCIDSRGAESQRQQRRGGGGRRALAKTLSLPGARQRVHAQEEEAQRRPEYQDFFGAAAGAAADDAGGEERGKTPSTTKTASSEFALDSSFFISTLRQQRDDNNPTAQNAAAADVCPCFLRNNNALSPTSSSSSSSTIDAGVLSAPNQHIVTRGAEGRDDDEEQEEEGAGFSARILTDQGGRAMATAVADADAAEAPAHALVAVKVDDAELLLHRAIRNEDWPSVLRLACHRAPTVAAAMAAACSRPMPFQFRGHRTTATLLHEACVRAPPPDVVDALLDAHPPSAIQGDGAGGHLPVHLAIMTGASPEAVCRLLLLRRPHGQHQGEQGSRSSSKCDREGNAALHHAAAFGSDKVLRVALEAASETAAGPAAAPAAAAAIANRRGRTPLHLLCARCGNDEGAAAATGEAPASSACGDERSIQLETIKSIIEAHPDGVSHKDRRGRLPLHEACNSFHPRLDLIDLLLDAGGHETTAARDDRGNTPLDLLRAVRPGIVVKSASAAGHVGIHPTLARLVRTTELSTKRTLSERAKAPALVAARIVRRAAASLRPAGHCGGGRLFRRSENVIAPSSDEVPRSEEEVVVSDGAARRCLGVVGGGRAGRRRSTKDSGTYAGHRSPVTTFKRTYTLPH